MRSFSTICKMLSLLTILFIVVSCKKSDPYQPTTQELLQNKEWKLSSLTINPALNGTTDYLNGAMQPCERDNVYWFGYSVLWSAFSLEEGTNVCDPANTSYGGFWSFNPGTNVLNFSYGASSTNMTIFTMTVEGVSENGFTGKTTDTIAGNIYAKTWAFIRN